MQSWPRDASAPGAEGSEWPLRPLHDDTEARESRKQHSNNKAEQNDEYITNARVKETLSSRRYETSLFQGIPSYAVDQFEAIRSQMNTTIPSADDHKGVLAVLEQETWKGQRKMCQGLIISFAGQSCVKSSKLAFLTHQGIQEVC